MMYYNDRQPTFTTLQENDEEEGFIYTEERKYSTRLVHVIAEVNENEIIVFSEPEKQKEQKKLVDLADFFLQEIRF